MSTSRFGLSFIVACITPLFASSAELIGPVASQYQMHTAVTPPGLVAQARQATERFQDVREAAGASYEQFLGCVSGPEVGAMGIHFVNSNIVDGQLDVNHPEALIYESRGGAVRLVGVEYIVPADAWHEKNALPPVLEGQSFHFVDSPNRFGLPPFYELHVWAWRDNPNGAFVDWNTRVSCEGE